VLNNLFDESDESDESDSDTYVYYLWFPLSAALGSLGSKVIGMRNDSAFKICVEFGNCEFRLEPGDIKLLEEKQWLDTNGLVIDNEIIFSHVNIRVAVC